MKNKIILIMGFALGFSASIFAQTQLTIAPDFGVIFGQVDEEVYASESSDKKVSELTWPIVPAYLYGANVTGQLAVKDNANIFLFAKFRGDINGALNKLFIDGNVGQMTDSDWLNVYYSGWPQGKTNYSVSNAILNQAIQTEFAFGGDIGDETLKMSGAIGMSYTIYSWTARDGYYQYPTDDPTNQSGFPLWSENLEKIPIYGDSIIYTYKSLSLDLRLAFKWNVTPLVWLNFETIISPIYWVEDHDQHLLRDIDFVGKSTGKILANTNDGVFMFALGVSFEAPIIDNYLRWGIDLNGRTATTNRNKQTMTYTADTTDAYGKPVSAGTTVDVGAGGTSEFSFYTMIYIKYVIGDTGSTASN